jgi:hypothetical protein
MGTHQHRVADNDSHPGDRREPRGPFDVVHGRDGSVAAHVGELRDLTRISSVAHRATSGPRRSPCIDSNSLMPAGRCKFAVEADGGADEREMREGLREVAEELAARSDLLGVEPEMVRVGVRLFEDEANTPPTTPAAFRARVLGGGCPGVSSHETQGWRAERY